MRRRISAQRPLPLSPAALSAAIGMPRTGFELDVSFELMAGETLALMGPSGAGKSSIVHALAGTERLTAGRIVLGGAQGLVLADAGERVHVPPHARGVGLLGQEPRLFPHLSAARNIAFAARARGTGKREALAEADGWLTRLGLDEVAAKLPAELSGGQRQRIALARALAAAPRLLLVDEPFASLDVEAAADMRALLREELKRTGTTAVVVSHSAVDAAELAHRLIVIERGRIAQQGEVHAVLAAPATRFVRAVAATLPTRPVRD
ncbi:ATP-binding cassette domain-containing protein [Leucobacter sp. HY1908]